VSGCSRWNSAGGPPDTSNCYCHPGKAGGSPAYARVSNQTQTLKEDAATADSIAIRAVPLDNYRKFSPTFGKLDVEGSEVEALKGARNLLSEHKPKMYIAIHPQFLPLFEQDSRDLFPLIPDDMYNICLYSSDLPNWTSTTLDKNLILKQPAVMILTSKGLRPEMDWQWQAVKSHLGQAAAVG